MKKRILLFMAVLLVCVTVPASALELTGNIWLLSNDDEQAEDETNIMYQGDLTLIGLGPVRIMGGLEYNGKSQDLFHLFNLMRGKVEQEDFADYENAMYMIGGATGRVRVDWPLFNGLSAIGSIGHRFAGSLEKTEGLTDFQLTNALYGGTIYSGGLGLELVRGLSLYSIYEIGPAFNGLHDLDAEASWSSWDVGLEYKIPFISVRAGYRDQKLEADISGFELSGVYLGAGIHF